ncbi:putative peptide maturation dehydrogenase [Xanthomonas arboricola]|uniref:putative peptide maturation dehydrogenase n=1 Tax=Xanthomonas arboricola TaxID=56448 RepID=UPI000CED9167|nr:putative peptide maturation dehydrogenase [Xanthomonas arboricola]PPU16360.1 putative peptide maturation dehydrogenase [Xanthomonas arboricola]
MLIRRCEIVLFQPREDISFEMASLLAGGDGLVRSLSWIAIAPHLEEEAVVTIDELVLLGKLGPDTWVDRRSIEVEDLGIIDRLLDIGLLVSKNKRYKFNNDRDEKVRSNFWWPFAAVMQKAGRWKGVNSVADMETSQTVTVEQMRHQLGPPPTETLVFKSKKDRVFLEKFKPTKFDAMLESRVTCRNFADDREVSYEIFCRMLQRVVMATAEVEVCSDTIFLKKNVPSAGGLHPIDIYIAVRNVDGIEAGLYYYHPSEHALYYLQPQLPSLDKSMLEFLSGQHWLANAAVHVILVARYARCFWKYKYHKKAYRALILDAGHISQGLYNSATEMKLGAYVTSAINEADIESALCLDPLMQGPLAICGFGWRAEEATTTEFDPNNRIWAS